MHRIGAWICGWAAIAAWPAVSAPGLATGAADFEFDAARPAQVVQGFGVNAWPGEKAMSGLIRELGLRWVRLWIGTRGAPPEGADAAAMDRHWTDAGPKPETLRATAAWGVKTVAGLGAPPKEWLGLRNRLPASRHADFARYWAAGVKHLDACGLRPALIELYNEPDGTWSVHVTPEENAAIVKLVRAELDARGFRDVGIAGPGTAHCDWKDDGDTYVRAMDAATLRSLAAWSNHAWEWDSSAINSANGPAYLRSHWPGELAPIRAKDPDGLRPIFVTEYATKATEFLGTRYEENLATSRRAASDSASYAVRVFGNTLELLDGGASVLMLWEGVDPSWSDKSWGILRSRREGHAPRPVFHALKTLLPHVPEGARVLTPVRRPDRIEGAAMRKDGRIVIGLANGRAETGRVGVAISNAGALRVANALAFRDGKAGEAPAPAIAGNRFEVLLPPDGTMTVLLDEVR